MTLLHRVSGMPLPTNRLRFLQGVFEGVPPFPTVPMGKGDVEGGVPDAPVGTRILRADMESAPTTAENFGPGGARRREIKKR